MYENSDIINLLIDEANEKALEDRMLYVNFFKLIEDFANKNNLILGGINGINLLIDNVNINKDSFYYEFYSNDALKLSKLLVDAIYNSDSKNLGKYTQMITKVPYFQFSIFVNTRELVTIFNLPVHHGIETENIITPIIKKSLFSDTKLKIFNAELQLINIYSTLCNPAKADKWNDYLDYEKKLQTIFKNEFIEKVNTLDAVLESQMMESKVSNNIIVALIDKLIKDSSRILIGNTATCILRKIPIDNEKRIQIISSYDFYQEIKEVEKVAKQFGFRIQFGINDLKNPLESRLKRLTIYIENKDVKREPLIDIFNTSTYDLVPYITIDDIKVGCIFILMKYRLLDIWTMQLIMRIGTSDKKYVKFILTKMFDDYIKLSILYDNYIKSSSFENINGESYVGAYEDITLSYKRKAQMDNFYPPPYSPISID